MVIWLFAGGGQSEVQALVPFLVKHFTGCRFERKTPVRRKPGSKPNKKVPGYGRTGRSLASQITDMLTESAKHCEQCDAILVVDDLDCRDADITKQMFDQAMGAVQLYKATDKFVGFASPEIEAWIIADWDNSIARHPDFRSRHQAMKYWLSTHKNVNFEAPEDFGTYCASRDACDEKISDAIIESSEEYHHPNRISRYKKGFHTPTLLMDVDPNIVADKCPLFKDIFEDLTNFARSMP